MDDDGTEGWMSDISLGLSSHGYEPREQLRVSDGEHSQLKTSMEQQGS